MIGSRRLIGLLSSRHQWARSGHWTNLPQSAQECSTLLCRVSGPPDVKDVETSTSEFSSIRIVRRGNRPPRLALMPCDLKSLWSRHVDQPPASSRCPDSLLRIAATYGRRKLVALPARGDCGSRPGRQSPAGQHFGGESSVRRQEP